MEILENGVYSLLKVTYTKNDMVNSACWSFMVSKYQFYETKWRTALFSLFSMLLKVLCWTDLVHTWLLLPSYESHFMKYVSILNSFFFFSSPFILFKKIFFESVLIKIVEKILHSLPPSFQCLWNQPRFHSTSPLFVLHFICSLLQSCSTNLSENIPAPEWLH